MTVSIHFVIVSASCIPIDTSTPGEKSVSIDAVSELNTGFSKQQPQA